MSGCKNGSKKRKQQDRCSDDFVGTLKALMTESLNTMKAQVTKMEELANRLDNIDTDMQCVVEDSSKKAEKIGMLQEENTGLKSKLTERNTALADVAKNLSETSQDMLSSLNQDG
jgi:chromosome segregation ATPase